MCVFLPGLHTQENGQGTLSIDAATAEIFPREQPSGAREIIVIDDDSDDDTGGSYQWSNIPIRSEPVPKTEPPDDSMTDVHDQQGTSNTYDIAASQQPFTVPIPDDTQLSHGLPGPQLPTEEAHLECPTSSDTQAQTPNHGPTPQWPPFLHEPSPVDSTYLHPHQLSQPTPTDPCAPEAIMAPSPLGQSPPAPGHGSSCQMQPKAKPCQDAEQYAYFKQARNASSQFQLDSDGQLRWIAPKTPSAVATKQKPMSARQHEELRARILPTGKEPQPTQHKASMPDSHQTSYVTPHGFKRSF